MDVECTVNYNFVENVTFTDLSFGNDFVSEKTLEAIKGFSSAWDDSFKMPSLLSQRISEKKFSAGINQNNKNESLDVQIKKSQTDLRYWGLPDEIVNKYAKKGIKNMFNWQVQCLNNSRVMEENGNLIYTAPTSAGKTLVAEILTIKTVLEKRKKVVIILPFVSVVREKMFYFQDIFSESGIRVEGFMGSHAPPGGIESVHIAICTIEKANSLINRMMEDGNISNLGAVVVDELHLLGDPHRGYILELLLTKLTYVTKKYEEVNIQIVGMSATLPNLEILTDWLDADLYKTDFRPIPLDEYCLSSSVLYDSNFDKVRDLKSLDDIPKDSDHIIQLCLETIFNGCSVLIFCPTKNWCENLAQQIAFAFKNLGYSNSPNGANLRKQLDGKSINEVLEQLKSSPVGLDSVLCNTISFGIAFHHAGLTLDERDIIEGSFKSNALRVLVATSTLSSGVNLPARRVIIRSPLFNSRPINILTYKQMVGRAGRMGIDSAGESILICSANDKRIASNLISGNLNPISSCLEGEDKLMRAVLEAVASEVALTKDDICLFTNCTLLFSSSIDSELTTFAEKTIEQLKVFELIRLQKNEDETFYTATPLGKACLSSSMSPQDGLSLFIELQKARECFVLETDLHIIYLVTPYSICSQWGDLNWLHFLNLWENLSAAMKRVGKLIGIQESLIYQCMRNSDKMHTPAMQKKYQVYRRFYTALALQDLVNEVPLNIVAEKFSCSRGMLQSLQQSAATFAGMVTAFTHQLGWKNFEILVSQFQDRLHFGIQSELLDLMKLQSLNGLRARAIFNKGLETICQLANASVSVVENALNSAIPFQSEKIREGEHEYDADKRNNMKTVWITGKKGVSTKEAAELLIFEARSYLQMELGVSNVNWKSNTAQTSSVNNTNIITQCTLNNCIAEKLRADNDNGLINDQIETSALQTTKTICNSIVLQHSTPNNVNSSTSTSRDSLIEFNDSGNITHDSDVKDSMSDLNSDLNIENKLETSPNKNSENSPLSDSLCITNKSSSIFESDLSKSLSIFDESFLVDTQLCGILDHKQSINSSDKMKLDNSGASMPVIRGLDSALSLENVFATSFDYETKLDAFEDLKPNLIKKENVLMNDINPLKVNENKRKHSIEGNDCNSQWGMTIKNQTPRKQCKIVHRNNINKNIGNHNLPDILKYHHEKIDLSNILTKNKNDRNLDAWINIFYCDNYAVFENFTAKIMDVKVLSLYVHTGKIKVPIKTPIGCNIMKSYKPEIDVKNCTHRDVYIKGIAIYMDDHNAIYFDFQSVNIRINDILSFFQKVFADKNRKIVMFDSKSMFLILNKCCGITIHCAWEDPLIADWLLDSQCLIKPLMKMVDIYCSYNLDTILKQIQDNQNIKLKSDVSITCLKAWAVSHVMDSINKIFICQYPEMIHVFGVEMKALRVLASCELAGIRVDKNVAGIILNRIKSTQKILEKRAYKIAGRRFKFTSTSEVAKVIGLNNRRKVSTNKKILEKIDNPLAQIVIHWRKLNAILTKNLFPLILKAVNNSCDDRIYGSYWTHTSTGRMTMQEPNLQCIPRNFEIPLEFLTEELDKSNSNSSTFLKNSLFCCRNIFISDHSKILISADYCQLELRLLSHMSKDETLMRIVKSNEDIFKAIASAWKCIPSDEVDDDLRQKTKQMCYGIIYGMGIKSLAQNLDMCEIEADVFLRTFHAAYPNIKIFVNETIEECKKLGYVETLNGRRRYLPSINSINYSEKSHAERQAVNTTIQGSAADILKSAMISVNARLHKTFKDASNIKLVLLLHDEMMYEVSSCELNSFAIILKECMESTVNLSVPLPVKMKCGKAWGDMEEFM